MNDLLELSIDAMEYVVIEERLVEPVRNKWVQYKAICPIECIQPSIINNMSVNSHRVLTLLCTQSHKLGIDVALCHSNTKLMLCI